ncbi:MAG: phosphodiester glycosidase family protein [Planctomycetia bacterium]|nr:phosphodiester glycosidase family protein [Planctomycetia bacterium]
MRRRFWRLNAVLLAVAFGLLARTDRAVAQSTETTTSPFEGVTLINLVQGGATPQNIHITEINPNAPGISFQLTPQTTSFPPGMPASDGGIPNETVSQTTRQYVDQIGAQFAINGSFFSEANHTNFAGQTSANNLGLAASNGNAYSPWESPFFSDGTNPGVTKFHSAINLSSTNSALMIQQAAQIPSGFDSVPQNSRASGNPNDLQLYNTLTGYVPVLQNGVNVAPSGTGNLSTNPSTLLGYKADGTIVFATIDGRQTGFASGMTPIQAGTLLAGYGVTNAILLDGGGSTTMAANYNGDTYANATDSFSSITPGGQVAARLTNSPVGLGSVSSERYVGNNLAVFAQANPAYVPQAQPTVPAGVVIHDDFQVGAGNFASSGNPASNLAYSPTFTFANGASSSGIATTTQSNKVATDSYLNTGSLRIDVLPTSSTVRVREATNDSFNMASGANKGGNVGFLLKVNPNGNVSTGQLQASILIDEDNNSHVTQGAPITIVADGQWHLYQWNLNGSGWLNYFQGSTNGLINGSNIEVDSLLLTSSGSFLNPWSVFVDSIANNPNGDLSGLLPLNPDTNGDGVVDISDIQTIATNWLHTGPPPSAADANNDGVVDISDVQTIAAHWLEAWPPGGSGAGAVPEPASVVTLAMGLLGVAIFTVFRRRLVVTRAARVLPWHARTTRGSGVGTREVSP